MRQLTITQLFKNKEYRNRLPVSYPTFKKKFLTDSSLNELERQNAVLIIGTDKKKVVKILNLDKFLDYFFKVGVEQ